MKTIIRYLTIVTLLFACSKEQIDLGSQNQDILYKKGGGGSGSTSIVSTDTATYILPFGATSGGTIQSPGSRSTVIERGICYHTAPNPSTANSTVSSGSGTGSFSTILSGLSGNTKYYMKAYAKIEKTVKNITQITTSYGNEISFTTSDPNFGTLTDVDGNVYTTIQIGTQVWMVENLRTTKYRDGTPISNVTDDASWFSLSSGAYCNYGNNANNANTYGRLYNWFAVNDAHNIAPTGWHMPSTAEWQTLVNTVGGGALYDAGSKLKEAGFTHWNAPAVSGNEGNNSSGFTALGGGERSIYPSSAPFISMKQSGTWWTATSSSASNGDYAYLQSSTSAIFGSGWGGTSYNHDKRCGFSVRLIKDN